MKSNQIRFLAQEPFHAVPASKTYDFGFGDDSCGYAACVRNGIVFEKTKRRQFFQRKVIFGKL